MYINERIMAGQLHDNATQFPPASNGNVKFSFTIRQSRPIRLSDGKSGTATEFAKCTFWSTSERASFHAERLKKNAWVIVEGRHTTTKRQTGEEVATYHEIEISNSPQYLPKGKQPPYINRHTLVGNLGRDAKIFPASDSGNVKIVFSTASTRSKLNQGQWVEETTWFDHVLFVVEKHLERYKQLLTKGSTVWIEGRHDVHKREIEGETKYFPEILVSNVKGFVTQSKDANDTSEHAGAAPVQEKPRAEDEHKSAFQPASFS